nr:hypothetical protein Iba_chr08eCG4600 [Ipomoea batatas]
MPLEGALCFWFAPFARGNFDFPTSWPTYYFKLDRHACADRRVAQQVQAFRDLVRVQGDLPVFELGSFSKNAGLLPHGRAGLPGQRSLWMQLPPHRLFSSPLRAALADSEPYESGLRPRRPAGEEPSGSSTATLTLTVYRNGRILDVRTRFNYKPLGMGGESYFPCDHELADYWRGGLSTTDDCPPLRASHRILILRRASAACREAEERTLALAEESLFSAFRIIKNSDYRYAAKIVIGGLLMPGSQRMQPRDKYAKPLHLPSSVSLPTDLVASASSFILGLISS